MLELTQHESNLLLWTKGHYENPCHETFWNQLEFFYKHHYWMEPDVEGIYVMVRKLWRKIINILPNKEFLLEEYEKETLPTKVRFYWGAPNYLNKNIFCNDSFDTIQMIKSRIVVMCSQLGTTEVKYYKLLPITDIGALKYKRKSFYRVCNTSERKGLWYNFDGTFSGLIHDEMSFCQNKDLKMDYDESIVGWLSAVKHLHDLWQWFSKDDVRELEKRGFYITEYEVEEYRFYEKFQHYVINQETSVVKRIIKLEEIGKYEHN